MRRRRLMAILLSGVMTCSLLYGCSGGGNTETQSQTTAAATTAAAGTTTAASGGGAAEAGTTAAAQETTAAPEKTYDEKIAFSMTNYFSMMYAAGGADYKSDPYHQWIEEKFNVDVDLWAAPESEVNQKARLWINSGEMPDLMVVNSGMGIAEIRNYAEQGLIKEIPDDYETRWPNIAKLLNLSGVKNLLTVDGHLYGLPSTTFLNFLDNITVPIPEHNTLLFRQDWAEQVGMGDMNKDGHITLSVFKEYLQKVKAAGLSDNPFAFTNSNYKYVFYNAYGLTTQNYLEKSDGFVWIGMQDNFKPMIKEMQSWYNEGLIFPEYFNNGLDYYKQALVNGQIAAVVSDASVEAFDKVIKLLDGDDSSAPGYGDSWGTVLDSSVVTADDGTINSIGKYNYWLTYMFNPDTDDAVQERILDIYDWLCTREAEITHYRGRTGIDWEYADDGSVVQLDGKPQERHDTYQTWMHMGSDSDDIVFSGLLEQYPQAIIDRVERNYELRFSGVIFGPSDNYNMYQSDAKSNYSVPVDSKVNEIVCNNEDVDATWDAFVDEYRGIWEPLQDELNDTYY